MKLEPHKALRKLLLKRTVIQDGRLSVSVEPAVLTTTIFGTFGRTASALGFCLTCQKCHIRLVLPKVKSATDRWSDENSLAKLPNVVVNSRAETARCKDSNVQ